MRWKYNGYRFPKRDLWKVVDTLRSYFAANHKYAVVGQLMEIANYRKLVRKGFDAHFDNCASTFLGQCTCDFFCHMKDVRDFITDKQRDQNGLLGQFVEYGRDYLFVLRG